ncbi:MAG TPA: PAS domain-containing protein [Candidatus Limnocylindrales bacterium]
MSEATPASADPCDELRLPADSFSVLLVEDNPGDARLIEAALCDSGSVRLARVGRLDEGLRRLSAEPFDAVLLDLDLPDSHGFDTLAAILAETRVPVLVMTGLDDESVGLQAIRHGAQDYLVKGRVSDELLRRSLRYAIERSHLQAAVSTPLIETAPIGLAVLDYQLHFLYVNPALARMDGLPAVAHLGQRIDRVVPELGIETVELLVRVVATGQAISDVEVNGPTPSGSGPATWLMSAVALRDAAGETVGLTLSVVEITERKHRERALAALSELRRQAQAIGESIPFAIWIAEPDGRMKYLSESFLALVGKTMEQARDFGWMEALAEDSIAPTKRDWIDSTETGKPWNCEYVIDGSDGRRHTVLSLGNAVGNDAGTVTGWAGINLDITDRREADAFRDAFVGILSHELRTPITSIYAASMLLARPGLDDASRAELVADVSEEAERLRRLVEDLLVLAKAERGAIPVQLEPVLLQHILPRLCEEEQRRRPDLKIDVRVDRPVPVARAEEAFVVQILHNLLDNAAKYGPADGPIDIMLDAPDGSPRVRVLDRGPGVDPAEADRLFELFYRSDRTSRVAGSGIGLFVAKRLVEAIGGTIWARPRDDGPGAEFGFSLQPLREDAL